MSKLKIRNIKHNHTLMMLICCGIPIVLLILAVYIFGLNNRYLYWLILLLCPLMHYFMMKDMHKQHLNKEDNKKEGEKREKCH